MFEKYSNLDDGIRIRLLIPQILTDIRVSFGGEENKGLLEELVWQHQKDDETTVTKDELIQKVYEWSAMYREDEHKKLKLDSSNAI